jgi:two-component system, response regulator / RNA-binding antiterminator
MSLKALLIEDKVTEPSLAETLVRHGYSVINRGSGDPIPTLAAISQPDLAIFNIYSPQKYFQTIEQLGALPVIIFADDDSVHAIDQIMKAGVSAYVVNGFETGRINSIITIAIARFREQQRLKKQLLETKCRLEERKLVDRAKRLLTQHQGLTEDDAYHTLRKLAMNSNITIGDVAKNVISMAELIK